MRRIAHIWPNLVIAVFLTLGLGQFGDASGQALEEIIVTAQKREQSLQDVPLSVTALTGEATTKLGIEGFREWADYVPGITMFDGADANRRTGPTATIRGVTHVGSASLGQNSSSLTTANAIGSVPLYSADPFVYDMNRIEVMRGPQGTLFGIAAMGGVIRFIPNEAQTGDFSAEIGVDGGMIAHGSHAYKVQYMVNTPIVQDVLAVRLAGQYRKNNGYIDQYLPPLTETDQDLTPLTDNSVAASLGRGGNLIEDANKIEESSLRFSLSYTPNEHFTFKTSTTWQDRTEDNKHWADLNDVRDEPIVTQFSLAPGATEYVLTSIETSYDFDLGSVVFVGGYYNNEFLETFPLTEQARNFLSFGGIDSIDLDGPGGLPRDPYPARGGFPFQTETTIWTAELRLQGENKPLGISGFSADEMTFDYVVGAYYQDESKHGIFFQGLFPDWNANRGPNTAPILTEGGIIGGGRGGSDYENEAVFFDLTINLTPKLAVGGGLRYYEQTISAGQFNFGDLASGRFTQGFTVGDDLSTDDHPGPQTHSRETGVTPRATVSYQVDNDRMVYFTAAEGHRMGQGNANPTWPATGFIVPSVPAECAETAESLGILDDIHNGTTTDSVWSYELGLKSYWLDRQLLVNASVYRIDWTDFQQAIQLVQINPVCNDLIAAQVGAAQIDGVELEMSYNLSEHWFFNTAISYSDGEFIDIPVGVGSSLAGVSLKDGDSLRALAPWTASVGAEYRTEIPEFFGVSAPGYIRADWRYVDERMNNFGDEDLLRAHPIRGMFFMNEYQLVDIRAGVDGDDWSAQLYVSNVFDEVAEFESAVNIRQTAIRIGGINQPRTVGFRLTKRF